SDADYATWYRQGNGLAKKPSAAGEFSVATSGDNVLGGIYPAGVYSNTLTAKSEARLSSAAVHLDNNYDMWLRVIGDGGATARYVVQTYPRTGVIFPEAKLTKDWQWQKFDLTYWNGDELYVELAAGEDAPIQVNKEARSWFGMREAAIVPKGSPGPPAETSEFLDPLFDTAAKNPPKSIDDLADCYMKAITGAINAWRMGSASDAQAILLDTCLRQGLLSNRIDQLATAKPLVDEYRRLEAEIIVPTRVPGLQETVGKNQALFEHGNHKQPMAEVPRRFLEAIDATPYQTPLSGRRQLAEDVLRDDNPLTRRVIVNRIWHHLFGRGIVATPDNFGKLGIEPTHPELLDYLATRFEDHNGSIKDMIRFLVTSKTWQLTSRPSAKASEVDPDNHLWSHARLHRLEAESIRDELLVVSGSLNPELFGAPVDGNSPRRSVYVRVRRNAIDPFLRAFDFPEPFSATGQRDVTNVPAQSLTMMNDDRVAALASAWATRVLSDKKLATDEDRIRNMFLAALGRPARESEVARFQAYLLEAKNGHSQTAKEVAELHRKMDESRAGIANICEPIRSRLMAASATTQAVRNDLPRPIGRWEFKTDFQDLAGSAHGESRSGARIEGGALVLNHQGFVITEPLKQTIKEKTLQAWVQLDSLDQRGGGVMSIQTPDGAVFDAIVFGEQSPREWMAGSNFFQRTQSFNAAAEHEAASRPVQISIAYYADGRIAAYRDGQP
ncbi:MAG TPA: DUF1553 domain-containing protein, partial [Humisphaera sp.]|nr:DUF1553 domain-containing protein [Humisphaera sp.]